MSVDTKTGQTADEARYDRSLRLWGAQAQELLGAGHVLLLGATSVGCEILKNMTLPGLGHFTVVDGNKVTRRDLGVNFFLEQSDEGKSIAQATANILKELNPLVTGSFVEKDATTFANELVAAGADAIKKFTVIVATCQLSSSVLVKLGKATQGTGVALVNILTNGLTGMIRVQSDPCYIIHTVPDPDLKVEDMRPFHPFPELLAWLNSNDPSNPDMDIVDHSHLPWFLIVHFAWLKWRTQANAVGGDKDGDETQKFPKGLEWRGFKEVVTNMIRRKEPVQDNFLEARDLCNAKLLVENRYFPELKAILADARTAQPGKADNKFWFLAHGLLKFKEANKGLMPLPGDIPDFTATTAKYKELQVIFRNKGAKDALEIYGYINNALEKQGRAGEVTQAEVIEFSAHVWELNFLTFPTMEQHFAPKIDAAIFAQSADPTFKFYQAFGAFQAFHDQQGRYPGSGANDTVAADLATLKAIALAQGSTGIDDELAETVRAGGSEPIATNSILGAAGAQECIKLIQNRRVPICHSLVYDGIANVFLTVGDKK